MYKIGDKVKVRQDLEINKDYENVCFREGMKNYKTVTIKKIEESGSYCVEENDFWYSDEMFKPLHRELKDVRYGDVITNGEYYSYIFGRCDEAIFISCEEKTIEKAKKAASLRYYSLLEFLRGYEGWKIVQDEPDEKETDIIEIENIKIAERERIIKWANEYIETSTKHYGTNFYGVCLEDLKNFIKSL